MAVISIKGRAMWVAHISQSLLDLSDQWFYSRVDYNTILGYSRRYTNQIGILLTQFLLWRDSR